MARKTTRRCAATACATTIETPAISFPIIASVQSAAVVIMTGSLSATRRPAASTALFLNQSGCRFSGKDRKEKARLIDGLFCVRGFLTVDKFASDVTYCTGSDLFIGQAFWFFITVTEHITAPAMPGTVTICSGLTTHTAAARICPRRSVSK